MGIIANFTCGGAYQAYSMLGVGPALEVHISALELLLNRKADRLRPSDSVTTTV